MTPPRSRSRSGIPVLYSPNLISSEFCNNIWSLGPSTQVQDQPIKQCSLLFRSLPSLKARCETLGLDLLIIAFQIHGDRTPHHTCVCPENVEGSAEPRWSGFTPQPRATCSRSLRGRLCSVHVCRIDAIRATGSTRECVSTRCDLPGAQTAGTAERIGC